jgi:hypothetical protein
MAMIEARIAAIDLAMAQALPATLAALPIRERIARLVRFRLEAGGREEALRLALAIMARPPIWRLPPARAGTAPMRCGGWPAIRRWISTITPSAPRWRASMPRRWRCGG